MTFDQAHNNCLHRNLSRSIKGVMAIIKLIYCLYQIISWRGWKRLVVLSCTLPVSLFTKSDYVIILNWQSHIDQVQTMIYSCVGWICMKINSTVLDFGVHRCTRHLVPFWTSMHKEPVSSVHVGMGTIPSSIIVINMMMMMMIIMMVIIYNSQKQCLYCLSSVRFVASSLLFSVVQHSVPCAFEVVVRHVLVHCKPTHDRISPR